MPGIAGRPRTSGPGGRRRCAGTRRRAGRGASRSSMIMPAQVPSTGVPARASSRSGSSRPSRSIPSVIVVDSPPGRTSPSSPSRSGGHAHLAHRRRRAPRSTARARRSRPGARGRRCALPAAVGEQLVLVELARSRARSSPCRGPRTPRRPAPGRRSASSPRRSRARGAGGVLGLEDPEPTKTASAPSCIISAASAGVAIPPAEKSGDGQLAVARDLAHEVERRLELLRGGRELGVVEHGEALDLAA